jgi:hypothetical protein
MGSFNNISVHKGQTAGSDSALYYAVIKLPFPEILRTDMDDNYLQ